MTGEIGNRQATEGVVVHLLRRREGRSAPARGRRSPPARQAPRTARDRRRSVMPLRNPMVTKHALEDLTARRFVPVVSSLALAQA